MTQRGAETHPSVDLIIPSALGDALISTAVVRFLLDRCRADIRITAWTQFSWLFGAYGRNGKLECRQDVDRAPDTAVDLAAYLELLPHRRIPRKHHVLSMLEVLRSRLPALMGEHQEFVLPRIAVTGRDGEEAADAFASLRNWLSGRPCVWLSGRSTTINRNPGGRFWVEVAGMLEPVAAVVELLGPQDRPMDSELIRGVRLKPAAAGSFMKLCAAGIAVDTFGLHLAAACGFSRVAVVLGSSHPACVCYPGNRPVYRTQNSRHRASECDGAGIGGQCVP